jgi:hypothetical protein
MTLPNHPATHVIRVAPRNRRWEVSVDGTTRRMIDWLCTKQRALEHALEIAQTLAHGNAGESVDVFVEDPNDESRAHHLTRLSGRHARQLP